MHVELNQIHFEMTKWLIWFRLRFRQNVIWLLFWSSMFFRFVYTSFLNQSTREKNTIWNLWWHFCWRNKAVYLRVEALHRPFFFFNFVCVVWNICWIWAYFRLSLRSHTNITDKRKEIHYKQANICELYSCFLWCCCLCFEFTTNYILRINSSGNICGMLSGFWEQQKYTSKYISFLGTHYFHIYLPTLACLYTRKFSHI